MKKIDLSSNYYENDQFILRQDINKITELCFGRSFNAGWHHDVNTGELITPLPVTTKLLLIVTEIAEATEGYRKNLMDDKLPHRQMIEVELADALIRICDLAGMLNLDLGGAIAEKLEFNRTREDHKIKNRADDNGKQF